jgi:protein TonB
MYEAVRQRPGTSSKIAGASVSVVMLALAGYALTSGLAMKFVKTVMTETVMTMLPPDVATQPPVEPPEQMNTSTTIDLPPPLVFPDQVFVVDTPPVHVSEPPATTAGSGNTGAGVAPPPVRALPRIMPGEKPIYPASEERARHEGVTGLQVCVSEAGRVTDASVATTSGYPKLDEAALTWVKRAKFRAGTLGGKPQAMCGHRVEYEWQMPKP